MASGLDRAEANRLIGALLKGTAYTVPTAPLKLRLSTTNPTSTTTGTEPPNADGSSYAPVEITNKLGAASNGLVSNDQAITFTNMPSTTTTAVEVWDGAPTTPRRLCFGELTQSKATSTGDSLTFAGAALTFTLT